MEYKSEFDVSNGVCVICVTGKYRRPEDSEIIQRFVVEYVSTHECHHFLIDLTQAEVLGGTMPVFNAANPKGELAPPLRTVKTAVVRRELTPDDSFFETVAANRGFPYHAFDSFDKAIKWLEESK